MYKDPANPYGIYDSGYTGETEEPGEVQPDETLLNPGGDGYWWLVSGVWRWITEPLGRTATTTS